MTMSRRMARVYPARAGVSQSRAPSVARAAAGRYLLASMAKRHALRRLLHPLLFQGDLRRRRYFEGWYFKHVAAGGGAVFAFIPGVSLSPDGIDRVRADDRRRDRRHALVPVPARGVLVLPRRVRRLGG